MDLKMADMQHVETDFGEVERGLDIVAALNF